MPFERLQTRKTDVSNAGIHLNEASEHAQKYPLAQTSPPWQLLGELNAFRAC